MLVYYKLCLFVKKGEATAYLCTDEQKTEEGEKMMVQERENFWNNILEKVREMGSNAKVKVF